MEFNIETLNSLLKNLNLDNDIELSDIPNLDLYMDQIITLFDDKLDNLKRNDNDKILTKTMINNYTKAKILMPPTKKKYTKNHIILLVLIYHLKQNLSINDINILFKDIINNSIIDDSKTLDISKIYTTFLNIKKIEKEKINTELLDKIKLIDDSSESFPLDNLDYFKALISVLVFINQANTYRRLAEKIIDDFFKDYNLKI